MLDPTAMRDVLIYFSHESVRYSHILLKELELLLRMTKLGRPRSLILFPKALLMAANC